MSPLPITFTEHRNKKTSQCREFTPLLSNTLIYLFIFNYNNPLVGKNMQKTCNLSLDKPELSQTDAGKEGKCICDTDISTQINCKQHFDRALVINEHIHGDGIMLERTTRQAWQKFILFNILSSIFPKVLKKKHILFFSLSPSVPTGFSNWKTVLYI